MRICKSCGDEFDTGHEFRALATNYPEVCGCGWHRSNREHLPLCHGCQVHICEDWLGANAGVKSPDSHLGAIEP